MLFPLSHRVKPLFGGPCLLPSLTLILGKIFNVQMGTLLMVTNGKLDGVSGQQI